MGASEVDWEEVGSKWLEQDSLYCHRSALFRTWPTNLCGSALDQDAVAPSAGRHHRDRRCSRPPSGTAARSDPPRTAPCLRAILQGSSALEVVTSHRHAHPSGMKMVTPVGWLFIESCQPPVSTCERSLLNIHLHPGRHEHLHYPPPGTGTHTHLLADGSPDVRARFIVHAVVARASLDNPHERLG